MLEGTHGTAPQGATLGTRIDRYRALIMPLRFVCLLRNNTAQSLVLRTQGSHTQKTSELWLELYDESAVFCVKGKRSTKAQVKQLAHRGNCG